MRWSFAFLPLLLVTLIGCDDASVDGSTQVGELLAPASAPKVYEAYEELAPLFEQASDTTYLINFWATWCKPCLEELPLLREVAAAYADEPFRVVLVSLDRKPEAIARIPEFLSQQDIDLPTVVLTDENSEWMRELDEHWSGQLPTTFIYRGELRYVYRRPFATLPDVKDAVAPLIGR